MGEGGRTVFSECSGAEFFLAVDVALVTPDILAFEAVGAMTATLLAISISFSTESEYFNLHFSGTQHLLYRQP